MRKITALLVSITFAVSAFAQPHKEFAFKSGETLELAVSFRAKMWPTTDMAKVVLKVSDDVVHSQPMYKIEAYATTTVFRWIFKMDDFYTTWLNKNTHLPAKSTSELSEGNYRFSSQYSYDWTNMKVHNSWRNHKRPDPTHKTIELTENSMDGVALFYRLRSEDMAAYKVGETHNLEFLLEDTIRIIQYRFIGPEVKDISGLGKIKTLKFACQIATSEGERFDDGTEFFLWVTDDRNKVPVYLESPIRFGSVTARLASYKNLKYVNDSVLP